MPAEPLDTRCASCGEELYNPFTGEDLKSWRDLDVAYEAHASECPGEFGEEL